VILDFYFLVEGQDKIFVSDQRGGFSAKQGKFILRPELNRGPSGIILTYRYGLAVIGFPIIIPGGDDGVKESLGSITQGNKQVIVFCLR
jgi:hypothetical protein